MNFKEMVTSFYKLLLWPNFQDTSLINQTIRSKLQEQVLCRETCVMYTALGVCFWQSCASEYMLSPSIRCGSRSYFFTFCKRAA